MDTPMKVMYVEDDADIRDITVMALDGDDFTLTVCESGVQALNIADKVQPDLLLLDVMMPGIDGPTTLARLREKAAYQDTPVIFMTAKVQPREVDQYVEMGALGVIAKPFDPLTLADEINRLLDRDSDGDGAKQPSNELLALRNQYSETLPEKTNEILESWLALTPDTFLSGHQELYRQVHSLAGSAKTFGFNEVGVTAKALEKFLYEHGLHILLDRREECYQQLERLHELALKGPDEDIQSDSTPPPLKRQHHLGEFLVYVLEDDKDLGAETVNQLEKFGYQLSVYSDLVSIRSAIKAKLPNALLIDINLHEGRNAGTDFAEELKEITDVELPIIFMSQHDTWQDRLNAVRAKGKAYISKPINFDELGALLDSIAGRTNLEPFRILIVDDTELLANHYAAVLRNAGMEVFVLTNPEEILATLPEFNPDLLLLDLYMPSCNGIEVTHVIRQHTGYGRLPIIYLSTETDYGAQLNALSAGGDDFLEKPISDHHLVSAVEIRVHRFGQLLRLMSTDSLTGLLNHINLKQMLEREISTAIRRNRPLCFVMIDIDNFKDINDQYGHPVGDRVIKNLSQLIQKRLRKSDIAGRYGGEEFGIILPDTSAFQAKEVIEDLKEIFSAFNFTSERHKFNVSFSAGIACSMDYQSATPLIVAADNALYQAKKLGRSRVEVTKKEH